MRHEHAAGAALEHSGGKALRRARLPDTSGCSASRFVDNGDGTVSDLQTGLMWEKKTYGQCVNLVDGLPVACITDADCTGSDTIVLPAGGESTGVPSERSKSWEIEVLTSSDREEHRRQ